MISVICVFNDVETLRGRLLSSLASQTEEHEVITVDNRDSRFERAATALNWGASQAKGDCLLFSHQDVAFLSPDWFRRAQETLSGDSFDSWYGVAGQTRSGKFRGLLLDRAALSGQPFDTPLEVQTLDECLLIHRRVAAGFKYFDEDVPGWHAYGVEACCAAIRRGETNYVVPLPIWHDSKSTNLLGLEESHAYVWHKHGRALKRISTTCGDLPGSYGWEAVPWQDSLKRAADRLQASYYHRLGGYPGAFSQNFDELLESLTLDEEVIESLHKSAWYGPLEAKSFTPKPRQSRRIIHRFEGYEAQTLESDCVVVAADLSSELGADLKQLQPLFKIARRLLICLDWDEALAQPRRWKTLKRRASEVHLTQQWDGTRVAILEWRANKR